MNISDFLKPADVAVDIRMSTKQQLLLEMSRRAAMRLDLPADIVASEILKREDLGSTGMGHGVAIPHARLQMVERSFGTLARLKQPVDFDAIDGRPVDIVFLILLPASPETDQLGTLALAARRLTAPEVRAQLRRAGNAPELYAAMI